VSTEDDAINSSDELRGNIFEGLLNTVRSRSLSQISNAPHEGGDLHRRSM
jgi:hypothetical protein